MFPHNHMEGGNWFDTGKVYRTGAIRQNEAPWNTQAVKCIRL